MGVRCLLHDLCLLIDAVIFLIYMSCMSAVIFMCFYLQSHRVIRALFLILPFIILSHSYSLFPTLRHLLWFGL